MKIAAVIVTYNRRNLLQNCLDCLERQTRVPDKVVIVNNASTDDTSEYLSGRINSIDTSILNLKENRGGAGGFEEGINWVMSTKEYDGMWLMDDDGEPEKTCLENLLKHWNESDFLSPLVVSITDHSRLSFDAEENKSVEKLVNGFKDAGVIVGRANPFNGILLKKQAIEKAGVPNGELFIWGDEVEYQSRLEHHGIIPITIINAIHYHPEDRMEKLNDVFGRKSIVYVDSPKKRYCKYRNTTYTQWRYGNKTGALKSLILYSSFFLLNRKFDIKGFLNYTKAWFHGVKGDLSHHNEYKF